MIRPLTLYILYPGGTRDKESICHFKRHERCECDLWVGKIPCERKWQHTPVFLPGKFHGQGSSAGYSPWGCKELDTPECQPSKTTNPEHPSVSRFFKTKSSHSYFSAAVQIQILLEILRKIYTLCGWLQFL